MPTRVLLEGPAIEPLLAQVRQEYGSAVRIISADKVRSGGLGGFFAKQHYELSVEVPDPVEEEPPHSLERMLQRAEAADDVARPAKGAGGPDRELENGREAGIEDTDAAAEGFRPDAGAAFAELLAGLDAANHIPGSGPAGSTPRPPAAADKTDTPTVRPFRPAAASGSRVFGTRPLPPVPSLADLMGGLGITGAEPSSAGPRTPESSAGSAGPDAGGTRETARPAAPGRSAAAAYGVNPAPTGPEQRPGHGSPVVDNLISVGLPESMAMQVTGGDTYAGVLSVLASLPAPPGIPDASGEILVLAGDLSHAVPMGRQLLAQIGADPSRLLLAGPSGAGTGLHPSRVLHDPKAAAVRAGKLHSGDSAWVVALDAPVGATDPTWVNDMCAALGATALWAVVDATRKTADTARHLRTLGEVEALVVHSVELTADPATVLGLDLPIFSLDGKPATPHTWAAMLCARIAADVRPATAPRRVTRSVRR